MKQLKINLNDEKMKRESINSKYLNLKEEMQQQTKEINKLKAELDDKKRTIKKYQTQSLQGSSLFGGSSSFISAGGHSFINKKVDINKQLFSNKLFNNDAPKRLPKIKENEENK